MNYINNSNLHNYMIDANYDITNYILLDNKVKNIVNKYIDDFIDNLPKYNIQSNITYYLNLLYYKYEYNNYLSYVYKIEEHIADVYPNYYVFTIIYDKYKNKIISIIDFIKKDNQILEKLSKLSKMELKKKYKFDLEDENLKSIFNDGTKGILKNYKNIVITEEGLLIIFQRYQIAPYYMGEFSVVIPFNKLQ